MDTFINGLEVFLHTFAHIVIFVLEFIGIIVILFGAIKAIYFVISNSIHKKHHNIKISLGLALALGLEFKMGAEIIRTVLVKDEKELIVLGAIILLRVLLSVIIHWEIKSERNGEKEEQKSTIKIETNAEMK